MSVFISDIPLIILKWMIPSYQWLEKYSRFRYITLFGVELPHPLQINIQLRKLHLLIQHFMILQLRHTTFITQSLKEIHSGRETGLIDTGPLITHEHSCKIIYVFENMKYEPAHEIFVSIANAQKHFLRPC